MDEDGEASHYLALSREYVSVARRAAADGALAAARFNSIHALELAVKAALVSRVGAAPKLHNVGGEFGKHFRPKLGPDVVRRVNRLLDDYNAPRYPDWKVPELGAIVADIAFVEELVSRHVPALMREAKP